MGKVTIGPVDTPQSVQSSQVIREIIITESIPVKKSHKRIHKYLKVLRQKQKALLSKIEEKQRPMLVSTQYDDSALQESLNVQASMLQSMDLDIVGLAAEVSKLQYRLDKYEGRLSILENSEKSQVTQIVRQEYILDKRVMVIMVGLFLVSTLIGLVF